MIFFYSITNIAGGESFHTTDLKGNWKRKEIKMIEYFKNKKTNKKVNLPIIETNTKLKAYILVKNNRYGGLTGQDINIEGKIYLLKEQAELNARLLQIKYPFTNYRIFELEVE